MSITFDAIVNPVILLGGIIGGVILGFGLGRIKLARSRAKCRELETELMSCHEETLEAQRAYVMLESRLKDQPSPVIPMKISATKENTKEKVSK